MDNRLIGVYAVKHKNEYIRAHSRSGGVFTALSDYILDNGGVVYGCVLDETFTAHHIRTQEKENRDKMRGSKYIQSRLEDSFIHVREDLAAGLTVLFTGTSCQIAGLQRFLGHKYSKLLCVDLVCHGVPSSNVWLKYLEWQEKNSGSKIVSVDFRNKRDFGWKAHVETVYFQNGLTIDSEVFKNLFYGHYILRPSCYECPYKSIYHPSDITIADYWGIDKAAPGFNDDKGVSLVLINTETGNEVFQAIKEKIICVPTHIEDSLQPPLQSPFPCPRNRDDFWKDFYHKEFGFIARKYAGYGKLNKIKRLCRKIMAKVGRMIKR